MTQERRSEKTLLFWECGWQCLIKYHTSFTVRQFFVHPFCRYLVLVQANSAWEVKRNANTKILATGFSRCDMIIILANLLLTRHDLCTPISLLFNFRAAISDLPAIALGEMNALQTPVHFSEVVAAPLIAILASALIRQPLCTVKSSVPHQNRNGI